MCPSWIQILKKSNKFQIGIFPILIIAVKETGDPCENCHQQPISLTQSFFLPAVQIQGSWSSIPLILKIETGRYDNIPCDKRLCNLCNCNRIEDETYFLLDCPSFSSIRHMFFSKLEPKILFLRLQSHESLLSHLMNSTDYFITIQLISFISTCFELRDKLISGIINPTDG